MTSVPSVPSLCLTAVLPHPQRTNSSGQRSQDMGKLHFLGTQLGTMREPCEGMSQRRPCKGAPARRGILVTRLVDLWWGRRRNNTPSSWPAALLVPLLSCCLSPLPCLVPLVWCSRYELSGTQPRGPDGMCDLGDMVVGLQWDSSKKGTQRGSRHREASRELSSSQTVH